MDSCYLGIEAKDVDATPDILKEFKVAVVSDLIELGGRIATYEEIGRTSEEDDYLFLAFNHQDSRDEFRDYLENGRYPTVIEVIYVPPF